MQARIAYKKAVDVPGGMTAAEFEAALRENPEEYLPDEEDDDAAEYWNSEDRSLTVFSPVVSS